MGDAYEQLKNAFLVELERMQVQMPEPVPTPEQRLDTLENTTDDMILMMADMIGDE